ncbi:MAG: beta-ketoacyl-ACP synthase III [Anaerolineales bacterium]|nr:beta-ketoacyl-ACP synthase III [Anaerolineales bacterium]
MPDIPNGLDRYAHICGWGTAVPDNILTNAELSKMVDTTDEWIMNRTGIKQRYIANDKETTASLGVKAAKSALDTANISPNDLDLIIVATSTPEHHFPSTASLIQDKLGARKAGAFDMGAACTGFVYALTVASQIIQSGSMNTVLIIGSETLSKIVNWEDRSTCVLFGDGAGAFVLQGSKVPGGILTSVLRSDGSGGDLLKVPAGGSAMPACYDSLRDNLHTITMNGREVFRFATRVMADACREVVSEAGMTMDDIDFIVPHQANVRIIEAAARNLGLPLDMFIMNMDRYGNTSAASIPLALCEAVSDNRIKPYNNLIFVAFGGGLTWGATLVTWDVTKTTSQNQVWHKLRRQALYRVARIRSAIRRGTRTIEGALWGEEEVADK